MSTPAHFPFPRTGPFDPRPDAVDDQPIRQVTLATGQPVWLVSGFAESQQVLADSAFSADSHRPGFPKLRRELFGLTSSGSPRSGEETLLRMDPPEHDALRALVAPYFSGRHLDLLGTAVGQAAARCVQEIRSTTGTVDLVSQLASPLPMRVIAKLLGVADDDAERLAELGGAMMSGGADQRKALRALAGVSRYLRELLSSRDPDSSDDLVSALLRSSRDHGLPDRQGVGAMIRLLLFAGYETCTKVLGMLLVDLLYGIDSWEHDRGERVVEEILRFHSIVDCGIARVCVKPASVGAVHFQPGDGVIVAVNLANRDPRHFPEPDQRSVRGEVRHLALGFGAHRCLGGSLARLEIRGVLDAWSSELADLVPAVPLERLEFDHEAFLFGPRRLPALWPT